MSNLQSWLEEHGPFKTIIDGANVAFWGQSFEQGQFQFGQIEKLVDAVCSELDQKPLVVSAILLSVSMISSPGTMLLHSPEPNC